MRDFYKRKKERIKAILSSRGMSVAAMVSTMAVTLLLVIITLFFFLSDDTVINAPEFVSFIDNLVANPVFLVCFKFIILILYFIKTVIARELSKHANPRWFLAFNIFAGSAIIIFIASFLFLGSGLFCEFSLSHENSIVLLSTVGAPMIIIEIVLGFTVSKGFTRYQRTLEAIKNIDRETGKVIL